jgi:hypothetical protein
MWSDSSSIPVSASGYEPSALSPGLGNDMMVVVPVFGPSNVVVVAKGSSEEELERLARLLHEAEIRFDVQEGFGNDLQNPEWRWEIVVGTTAVDQARRVLALEGTLPRTPEPPPTPLFHGHGQEAARIVLMLLTLGLAGGLWLRSCLT